MKTIALGSTSEHKISAATEALKRLALEFELKAVKTKSGVPEQPIGIDETMQGAWNRAVQAMADQPQAQYGLGVESGLVPLGTEFLDMAVVALVARDGTSHYSTSAGLQFPKEVVVKSIASRQAKTAGDFLAEATGCDGTDPHAHLTKGKVRRNKTLEDAIYMNLLGLT